MFVFFFNGLVINASNLKMIEILLSHVLMLYCSKFNLKWIQTISITSINMEHVEWVLTDNLFGLQADWDIAKASSVVKEP